MAIIMLTSIISLMVAGATLIVYNNYLAKKELINDLSSMGMLISDRTTAALTFNDAQLAEENLRVLKFKPVVIAAFILDAQGDIFAQYKTPMGENLLPPNGKMNDWYEFGDDKLMLIKPILLEGKQIGAIYIGASLQNFYEQQQNIFLFVFAIIILTSIIAFIFSLRLHGLVTTPILLLTDTARQIQQKQDYSLRASSRTDDEIGVLVKAFNEMLETIRIQNKDKKRLISELSESKSLINTILDSIPQGIFWKDREGYYLGCNISFAKMVGIESDDSIIGKTAYDLPWGSENYKNYLKLQDEVITSAEPSSHKVMQFTQADGMTVWLDITQIPIKNAEGEIVLSLEIFEDITERKKSEEEILNSNRVYSVLSQINESIVRVRNKEFLLKETCRIAVEYGSFRLAWVGLIDNESKKIQPFTWSGYEDGYLEYLKEISTTQDSQENGFNDATIREASYEVCNDIRNDPRILPWRDEALSRGYLSSITLPIRLGESVIGSFNLYVSVPLFFNEEEIYLLVEVTSNISFALEALESEKKRIEAVGALEKEKQFLSAVFQTMEDGLIACNADGLLTRFNRAAKEIHGLPEALISLNQWVQYYKLYSPDGKSEIAREDFPLLRALHGEQIHKEEMVIKAADGITRNIITGGQNLKDSNGEIIGAFVTMHDITESKNASAALMQSEARYKQLLESITDYIYSVEIQSGQVVKTVHQPGCLHVTGYSPAEIYADPRLWINMVFSEDKDLVEHYADPLLIGINIKPLEHRIINKNGFIRWIRNTYVLKHDEDGKLIGYDGLITDITERKNAEEELKLYRDHLEELVKQRTAELELEKEHAESADRLKSAFLATMSHELRTPLNSIIGFTGILMQERPGPLNPEQKKQLGMAQNSARHLLSLINDVLDISKIESGQLKVHPELFSLPEVIQKVIESTRPLAQKKNLEIHETIAENVGAIYSDKLRVQQIIINLINNAIKFTDEGFIRVEARQTDGFVHIKIIDTGIGITNSQIDQLFKPFIQIDSGLTRKHEGTGLGLSICKKLLTLLDGNIEVQSEFGIGSTFSISLPINKDFAT